MKNTDLGFSNRELKARLVEYYAVEKVLLVERIRIHKNLNEEFVRPNAIKYFNWDPALGKWITKDIHDPEFNAALIEPLGFLSVNVSLELTACQHIMKMNQEILAVVEYELEN